MPRFFGLHASLFRQLFALAFLSSFFFASLGKTQNLRAENSENRVIDCSEVSNFTSLQSQLVGFFLWQENWSNFFKSPDGPNEEIHRVANLITASKICAEKLRDSEKANDDFQLTKDIENTTNPFSIKSKKVEFKVAGIPIKIKTRGGRLKRWQLGNLEPIGFKWNPDGRIRELKSGERYLSFEYLDPGVVVYGPNGQETQVFTYGPDGVFALRPPAGNEIRFEMDEDGNSLVTSQSGAVHLVSADRNGKYYGPGGISDAKSNASLEKASYLSRSTKEELRKKYEDSLQKSSDWHSSTNEKTAQIGAYSTLISEKNGLVEFGVIENLVEKFENDGEGFLLSKKVFYSPSANFKNRDKPHKIDELEKKWGYPTEEPIYSFEVLERDELSRIRRVRELLYGTETFYTYDFDDANRLVHSTARGHLNWNHSYEYDANGNRIKKISNDIRVQTSRYDRADRLTDLSFDDVDLKVEHFDQGQQSLTYLPLSKEVIDLDFTSTRLFEARFQDGRTIRYVNDEMGRRAIRRVNGEVHRYFHYENKDNCSPVAEFDSEKNLVSQFFYLAPSTAPKYLRRFGRNYLLITNNIGSVRAVVDVITGEHSQILDYDDFGGVIGRVGPKQFVFQPFGFAGGILDPDTGMNYFCRRDYDPRLGRWVAPDDIHIGGGRPNVYQYNYNDPVNYVDPTGRNPFAAIFGGIWRGLGGVSKSLAGVSKGAAGGARGAGAGAGSGGAAGVGGGASKGWGVGGKGSGHGLPGEFGNGFKGWNNAKWNHNAANGTSTGTSRSGFLGNKKTTYHLNHNNIANNSGFGTGAGAGAGRGVGGAANGGKGGVGGKPGGGSGGKGGPSGGTGGKPGGGAGKPSGGAGSGKIVNNGKTTELGRQLQNGNKAYQNALANSAKNGAAGSRGVNGAGAGAGKAGANTGRGTNGAGGSSKGGTGAGSGTKPGGNAAGGVAKTGSQATKGANGGPKPGTGGRGTNGNASAGPKPGAQSNAGPKSSPRPKSSGPATGGIKPKGGNNAGPKPGGGVGPKGGGSGGPGGGTTGGAASGKGLGKPSAGPKPGGKPGGKPSAGPKPGGKPSAGPKPGGKPGGKPSTGPKPGGKPGGKPSAGPKPGGKPGGKPSAGPKPGGKPGGKPSAGPKPGGKPGGKPSAGPKPGGKPGGKPSAGPKPGGKPGGKPSAGPKPGGKPGGKPGAGPKPGGKPGGKPSAGPKPGGKPGGKPSAGPKPGGKPGGKPSAGPKPGGKPGGKPSAGPRPGGKPGGKPSAGPKPGGKPSAGPKPGGKPGGKPSVGPRPGGKPGGKPSTGPRPGGKPGGKPSAGPKTGKPSSGPKTSGRSGGSSKPSAGPKTSGKSSGSAKPSGGSRSGGSPKSSGSKGGSSKPSSGGRASKK